MKNHLFFPKIAFFNTKHIEKQLDYGVGNLEYFWMEFPHSLEYKEAIKATSYCQFEFETYPFDHHQCDFLIGIQVFSAINVVLLRPDFTFEGTHLVTPTTTNYKSEKVPSFDIRAESIIPFINKVYGYNYSSTGIKLHFKRNSIGFLIGSFYAPTTTFALLSMLSFTIAVDKVQ